MALQSTTTGLTWADLCERYGEDDVKRELYDGELVVSPSAVERHEWVVALLLGALVTWALEHGARVYAGLDVVLSDANVVRPDVFVLRAEHLDRVVDGYPRAAPDLAVEVSSPSTRRNGLGRKKAVHERFGLPEYWFVDLDADRVEVYRLADGRYGPPRLLARTDTLTTPELPGLVLPVAAFLPAGD